MLPDALELIIVTPERQLLREKVAEVQLPGADGELGILPGHAPLITELGIGELSFRSSSVGQPVVLAVLSGFAEVLPDRVTVLAETAQRPEEIDVERAKEALARG
jgi:F-type H+-transporting ATPase subunit epsilon